MPPNRRREGGEIPQRREKQRPTNPLPPSLRAMMFREAAAPAGSHPAFLGPKALAGVSAQFVSSHPAFARRREALATERVEVAGVDAGDRSDVEGAVVEELMLSPEWAEKLQATFARLSRPGMSRTSKGRHERRKKQKAKRRSDVSRGTTSA